MPEGRPAIPAELRRRVLVEAGHRCAIPTCRQNPVEIEHIEDWARVREHKFENLIALCPTCHARKGSGPNQIDRKSLLQYKASLAVLNSRYGEFERRLMEAHAENLHSGRATQDSALTYTLGAGAQMMVWYLLKDGFLTRVPWNGISLGGEVPLIELYQFTDSGSEFVQRWASAQPIDPASSTQ